MCTSDLKNYAITDRETRVFSWKRGYRSFAGIRKSISNICKGTAMGKEICSLI